MSTIYRSKIKYIFNNYIQLLNNNVKVCGWLQTIRKQGKNKFAFGQLNDGSTIKNIENGKKKINKPIK